MDHADHGGHGDSHETDAGRVTSPMQEFSTTQVGAGVAVLAAGLALTFGLAVLLG